MDWLTIILSIVVSIAILLGISIWIIVSYFNRVFRELEELKDLEDDNDVL